MLSRMRSRVAGVSRVRIGPVWVVLVCVLALAGCGSDESSGGSPSSTPSPSPSPSTGKLSDTVQYSRGGGVAGGSYRLTLRPDGSASLETPGSRAKDVKVSPEDLSGLAVDLGAADVPSLKARYEPTMQTADGFAHQIEVAGKTVTVAEGSDAPEPLQRLVARLSGLVDSLKG
jgi:hypothetical protein